METEDSLTWGTSSARREPPGSRPQSTAAYLAVLGATVIAGLVAAAVGYAVSARQVGGEVLLGVLCSGLLGAFAACR
jgi:hypothetical protein